MDQKLPPSILIANEIRFQNSSFLCLAMENLILCWFKPAHSSRWWNDFMQDPTASFMSFLSGERVLLIFPKFPSPDAHTLAIISSPNLANIKNLRAQFSLVEMETCHKNVFSNLNHFHLDVCSALALYFCVFSDIKRYIVVRTRENVFCLWHARYTEICVRE